MSIRIIRIAVDPTIIGMIIQEPIRPISAAVGSTIRGTIPVEPTIGRGSWSSPVSLLKGYFHFGLMTLVVLCADSGHEVDEEAQDVEEENEGDDPFEHCGDILFALIVADAKCWISLVTTE